MLKVFLPNVQKEKLELYQAASAIAIKADNFKRNITLPNVLCRYFVTSAKLEDDILSVQFEKNI